MRNVLTHNLYHVRQRVCESPSIAQCLRTKSSCLPSLPHGKGSVSGGTSPWLYKEGKKASLGACYPVKNKKSRFFHQLFTLRAAEKPRKIQEWAVEVRLPSLYSYLHLINGLSEAAGSPWPRLASQVLSLHHLWPASAGVLPQPHGPPTSHCSSDCIFSSSPSTFSKQPTRSRALRPKGVTRPLKDPLLCWCLGSWVGSRCLRGMAAGWGRVGPATSEHPQPGRASITPRLAGFRGRQQDGGSPAATKLLRRW